ncbi:hypothetical protein L1987_46214 [Smallanthus sonchifolius]|uniref:Uncharacterized protein n=1 Tax=Smallanthus sonchifolius TaxID=185202 RepID=A0ACB9FYY2_9ASTR|nr:hypothetical protein L1987_46214 [Smallanthus sonchifolius]
MKGYIFMYMSNWYDELMQLKYGSCLCCCKTIGNMFPQIFASVHEARSSNSNPSDHLLIECVNNDVIANRVSKAAHRFGRYLRVDDIDQMVRNLLSMWFESYHMYADVVRELPHDIPNPYANMLNGMKARLYKQSISAPVDGSQDMKRESSAEVRLK